MLFVGVAGLFLFRFGLPGVVLGGRYIAGGAEVTAQLDSETRFLSALALGAGALALWLVRGFEAAPKAAAGLSGAAFVGGLMRLVSMALFGLPGFVAIVATALEILIPTATIVLLAQRASDDGGEAGVRATG